MSENGEECAYGEESLRNLPQDIQGVREGV
jgi:hypothetical protein